MELRANWANDGRTAFAVLNAREIDAIVAEMRDVIEMEHYQRQDCDGNIIRERYNTIAFLDRNCEQSAEIDFKVTRYQTVYKGDYYTPDDADEEISVELNGIAVYDERDVPHPVTAEQWQEIERRVA